MPAEGLTLEVARLIRPRQRFVQSRTLKFWRTASMRRCAIDTSPHAQRRSNATGTFAAATPGVAAACIAARKAGSSEHIGTGQSPFASESSVSLGSFPGSPKLPSFPTRPPPRERTDVEKSCHRPSPRRVAPDTSETRRSFDSRLLTTTSLAARDREQLSGVAPWPATPAACGSSRSPAVPGWPQ